MVRVKSKHICIFTCLSLISFTLANSDQPEQLLEDSEDADQNFVILNENDTDLNLDTIYIDSNADPRGVVLRRWRRLVRSGLFRPGKYFRKIIAALVVPGTIAGILAGTVASSLVGVGAGGVAGGIAGAGLGGLGGILVPSVRIPEKYSSKDDTSDIDNSEILGRSVLESNHKTPKEKAEEDKIFFLLNKGISVERIYELRKKVKLLNIKRKFKSKREKLRWN